MFHQNARIEKQNGVRFYEKDVLLSNYLFTGDLMIEMKMDYLSPGAGIVLLEDNDLFMDKSANDIFVFKLGINDFTVIRKRYRKQDVVLHVSSNISPPQENLPLVFVKRGRVVELRTKDRIVGHYMLPRSIDKFKIGFYSNAGNILHHASFVSGMPNGWVVNIKNTNGGRVFFFKDGFHIENCERDAEVEQSNIFLEKGKYFLVYDKKNIRGQNDIESFVFLSSDKRFDDKEKSLLDENNMFELKEDAYVNVKFKGTNGQIENISIKNNLKDAYVSTNENPVVTDGSSMIILLDGLKSVKWKGIIHSVPEYDELTDKRDYGVISTRNKNYLLSDFNIRLDEEYQYHLDVSSMELKVFKEDELRSKQVIKLSDEDKNKVTVFRNMNAFIRDLIIKRDDGEEINILLQKTSKIYIPAVINGPIIVTDKYYIPLDLSSSYRISKREGEEDIVLFTNWEREVFSPNERIILEKQIIDAPGNIKVYGIHKDAETNIDRIYDITKEIDSIDLYASQYSLITEDQFEIDYFGNEIYLNDETKEKYKEIIVDYLKEGSYAVNYKEELHAYEVDISTSEEDIYIIYDYFEDDEESGSIDEYKITSIKPDPNKNKYIVLRKA